MQIFEIISSIAALISAFVAATALLLSIRTQKGMKENDKKIATIEAYSKLQEDVLDKLASFSKKEVTDAVEHRFVPKYKEIYSAYRVLIARCEHFAVGINNNIYDFETFRQLGGLHVKCLYEKIEPVIIEARKYSKDEKPYSEFEKLYKKLSGIYH